MDSGVYKLVLSMNTTTRLEFLKERGIELRNIVDVGAHFGEWYTAIKGIYPEANVYCIEANPQCAPQLTALGCQHEICLLGNTDHKEVDFYMARDGSTTGNSIFREQTQHFKDGNFDVTRLPMKTLDRVLNGRFDTVDLLKLDVQGAEKLVLEGAPETLKRTEFVLLEASILPYNKNAPLVADMVAVMDKYGFQLFDIMDMHYYKGYCNQCDLMFLRKTSHQWPYLGAHGIYTMRQPIHKIALSDGDRGQMIAYINEMKRKDSSYKVVIVGGASFSGSTTICDAVVDNAAQPGVYGKVFFKVDIIDQSTWVELLHYVKEHGKFDFSICTHVLQGKTNPAAVVDLLQRISEAGYIATPSKYVELARFENGPRGYRGHINHLWIFTIKDGQCLCYPKLNMIEHESAFDVISYMNREVRDLSFYWYKGIPFKTINDGYLGPSPIHVRSFYKSLMFDDVDGLLDSMKTVPNKVAFMMNDMGIRGTGTVTWFYAHYNEVILKNKSVIIIQKKEIDDVNPGLSTEDVREEMAKWFTDRFEVHVLETCDIDKKLEALKVDCCLVECSGFGGDADYIPKSVPTIAHCIFNGDKQQGTVHTVISDYLADKCKQKPYLLPNVVEVNTTTDDLRAELGIPIDAIVFGRYGGYKQFSIPFASNVVLKVAKSHPNIYFLFMNTKPIMAETLPNIIYLPGTRDMVYKRKFINTCSAMLHARIDGETFGCACGEFALSKKWVITCPTGDLAHLEILQGQAILYDSPQALENILVSFKDSEFNKVTPAFHSYDNYLPEKVMPYLRYYIALSQQLFLRRNGGVQNTSP